MRTTAARICALLERIASGVDRLNSDGCQPVGDPLSLAAAARKLGVNVETLRRQAKAGSVRVVRIGRRVLVPPAELSRLMAGESSKYSNSPSTSLGNSNSTQENVVQR
jgi:excisionase family DNA binding protein